MTATPGRLRNFEILARVAKGGMAEILLARQHGASGFSRLVVIKRILPHLAEEPEFVRMFLEEARLAALISHQNVVQIFDVGQVEGSHFIAMELIAGPSVGALCRRARAEGRPIPIEVAAEIVIQASEGLHAAHELRDEQGQPLELVHRDVSPHNLMITEAGIVKLVDFGIAKARVSTVKTRTGAVKGKYPYMSPELCRGEAVDRRADIFALGATCYELVVGERLFERPTELMTLKAITDELIPLPSSKRAEVPAEIEAVILRSLERDPDRRFQTAAEMGTALRQALERHGFQSSPRLVASYLEGECAELVQRRERAIKRVLAERSDARVADASVLSVEGFDDSVQLARGGTDGPSAREAVAPRTLLPWRKLVWIAAGLLLLSVAGGLWLRMARRPSRPAGEPVLFGTPPAFPEQVAREELRPFLDYLERKLQRPVDLVVPRDYQTLRRELVAGKLHLAVLPHLQFVIARHESPDLPVLAMETYEGSDSYQAYLVVLHQSRIGQLVDLRGARICYVDPGSASGYLIPRRFLREHGLDPGRTFAGARFSGNHTAVLTDVIDGRCDVGAVSSGALFAAPGHGVPASRLRVLAVTGECPFDVVAGSPRLPQALRRQLQRALVEFRPERDLGKKIIGQTFRIDGFDDKRLPDVREVEQAAREEGLIR